MKVLGIETSCDETGVAVYDGTAGLLSHALFSQVATHAVYGGVVPELASRDHVRKLVPLIREVLADSRLSLHDLNGVAYTAGPGLAGALMVGSALGHSLAWALGVPAIGVHHMEGHLLAPMLGRDPPSMPFLALLVSGGHTQLIQVDGIGRYRILGESLDDAAGEAFDKVAKMLGLGYPGGPQVERLAALGRRGRYQFPRPMTDRPGLDFSFSGLKTYTMNTLRAAAGEPDAAADIARAFMDAVIDTLLIKCRRALHETRAKTLVLSGGVSANRELRASLAVLGDELGVRVHYPEVEFCTDNGAMIAYAGYRRLAGGMREDLGFNVHPRWPITALPSI